VNKSARTTRKSPKAPARSRRYFLSQDYLKLNPSSQPVNRLPPLRRLHFKPTTPETLRPSAPALVFTCSVISFFFPFRIRKLLVFYRRIPSTFSWFGIFHVYPACRPLGQWRTRFLPLVYSALLQAFSRILELSLMCSSAPKPITILDYLAAAFDVEKNTLDISMPAAPL
jgi:hypothetical protein